MTEPTRRDVDVYNQPAEKFYSPQKRADGGSDWCLATEEEARKNLLGTGYPARKVHFVPGRVEETIPAQAPETVSVLRLDTDFYESTKHEMTHLFPRLSKHGVLILDDYGYWKGAREAVDEYLRENNLTMFLARIDHAGRVAVKA